MRDELAQWQRKQATGALNDRQERRMQFLQAQQQRQRMANQAANALPQAPQQRPMQPQGVTYPGTWNQGFPGPASDVAAQFGTAQASQPYHAGPGPSVKINKPSTWANHVSNRPQMGLLGQAIDPGFNVTPQYQPGSNPQLDAAFNQMLQKAPTPMPRAGTQAQNFNRGY